MIAFHLTDYRNVVAIRRDGLLPASHLVGVGRRVWWLSAAWSAAADAECGKRDCVYLAADLLHPIVPAFLARHGWQRIVVVHVDLAAVAALVTREEKEIRVHGVVPREAIFNFGKLSSWREVFAGPRNEDQRCAASEASAFRALPKSRDYRASCPVPPAEGADARPLGVDVIGGTSKLFPKS